MSAEWSRYPLNVVKTCTQGMRLRPSVLKVGAILVIIV